MKKYLLLMLLALVVSGCNLTGVNSTRSFEVEAPASFELTLAEAQKILKSKGLYLGDIDGAYDDKTKSALALYQSKNELKISGVLDFVTNKHITNNSVVFLEAKLKPLFSEIQHDVKCKIIFDKDVFFAIHKEHGMKYGEDYKLMSPSDITQLTWTYGACENGLLTTNGSTFGSISYVPRNHKEFIYVRTFGPISNGRLIDHHSLTSDISSHSGHAESYVILYDDGSRQVTSDEYYEYRDQWESRSRDMIHIDRISKLENESPLNDTLDITMQLVSGDNISVGDKGSFINLKSAVTDGYLKYNVKLNKGAKRNGEYKAKINVEILLTYDASLAFVLTTQEDTIKETIQVILNDKNNWNQKGTIKTSNIVIKNKAILVALSAKRELKDIDLYYYISSISND